jgi:hypothetical protein
MKIKTPQEKSLRLINKLNMMYVLHRVRMKVENKWPLVKPRTEWRNILCMKITDDCT